MGVSSSRRIAILLLAGLALVVVSVVILVTPRGVASFGWFAYAPMSGTTFTPGVFLGPVHLWAAALGIIGLVASSWAVGYLAGGRIGERRR